MTFILRTAKSHWSTLCRTVMRSLLYFLKITLVDILQVQCRGKATVARVLSSLLQLSGQEVMAALMTVESSEER